jgi:colanic acid/amylovoran biosynthesis protein
MENKKPKICLLGASFGTNNMGVNALTAGTLKAFYSQYPDGKLFLLDYGKKAITYDFQMGDHIVPVELVNVRFSKKFYLKNNIALLLALAIFARCIPFPKIRKRVIAGNIWLSRIAEADIVASIAGGDSFSDIYGMGRLLYVSLPQFLALILGKKLVLLPQTIGPFQGVLGKMIARIILNNATLVYSRDHQGLDDVNNLIGSNKADKKIRFCYDVGFLVDPVKPVEKDIERFTNLNSSKLPVIGFNVSGLLYMGGYTKNNMFGLKVDYRQLVFDVIEQLIIKTEATVLLVPHVFGSGQYSESDSAVCESIYAELRSRYPDKLYLVRGNYDQGGIKYIIGQCDFFIGSRMHACIAALSQNIPAVTIAYSDKFIGVLRTIHAEANVADPRKLTNEEILAVIDRVYEQRGRLRAELDKTMIRVKETILRLFPDIMDAA